MECIYRKTKDGEVKALREQVGELTKKVGEMEERIQELEGSVAQKDLEIQDLPARLEETCGGAYNDRS